MTTNHVDVDAPPEAVWSVLADAGRYASFVVGTKRIRRFDPSWPEPGSSLHHTIGAGPFRLRDRSTAVEARPPSSLTLVAGMHLLGASEVRFEMEPLDGGGTRVTMHEAPVRGPLAALWNPAFAGLLHARNALVLRRLRRLAARRTRTAVAAG